MVSRVEQSIVVVVPSCEGAILTQRQPLYHVSEPLCLCVGVGVYAWADVGVGRSCSWEEEGASPYMTGNSEDASLWDWQIG